MLNKFFRRNILGSLVLAPRAPCVQVAISATVPGVLPAFAGFAWVILTLTGILWTQYQDKVDTYSQPAFFGEIAFMLWLVIQGHQAASGGRRSLFVRGCLGCLGCLGCIADICSNQGAANHKR